MRMSSSTALDRNRDLTTFGSQGPKWGRSRVSRSISNLNSTLPRCIKYHKSNWNLPNSWEHCCEIAKSCRSGKYGARGRDSRALMLFGELLSPRTRTTRQLASSELLKAPKADQ